MPKIEETILKAFGVVIAATLLFYSVVGSRSKVRTIKEKAKIEMKYRGWEILRYEGYEYGSWGHHGGKVWYHVQDLKNPNIQYRVMITMWDGELHYTYGAPEVLGRIEVKTTSTPLIRE